MVDSYCCETENSDASLFVHWKNRHEQYLASYNNTYILCLMQKVTFYSQYILLEYVQTVHLLVCERFSVLYFLGISHFIVKRNIIFYNVIEPHQNLAVHGYHFHLIEKSSSGFNKKKLLSFVCSKLDVANPPQLSKGRLLNVRKIRNPGAIIIMSHYTTTHSMLAWNTGC